MTIEPEEPNTVVTALKLWSAAAVIIVGVVVVFPTTAFALMWLFFALGGRVEL